MKMMTEVEFDPKGHKYSINGEEVPSVSELCRFISKEAYSGAADHHMKTAADLGQRVHDATYELDMKKTISIDDPEVIPFIQAYAKFHKEHQVIWVERESIVHKGAEYAGRIDCYGLVDGVKTLVDIKSTSTITRKIKVLYTAAQNLYRKAMEPDMPVEAICILHLKKDGNYRLIGLEIEDTLADACLHLHNALKSTRRRKKND